MAVSKNTRHRASKKNGRKSPPSGSGTRVEVKYPAPAPRVPPSAPPPSVSTVRAASQPVPSAQPPPPPQTQKKANMCMGCNAFCCRLRVDLTLFDVARIMHMEGRPMGEFTTVAWAGNDDRFGIRLKGGLFKLVLMHDNGTCHFARAGELGCAIEKAKPAICLSYPFSIRDGVPYLRNDVACPFNNLLIADRTKMSKEVLEAMVYEADRYGETVSVWNGCAKGDEELSSFLKFAANDIEADRSAVGALKKSIGRAMLRMGLR